MNNILFKLILLCYLLPYSLNAANVGPNISATAPLTYTNGVMAMPAANGSVNGYLTAANFNIFNAKAPAGSYMTALTGDVTASGPGSAAATVAFVGGVGASTVATAVTAVGNATSTSTAGRLVIRDGSGNFSAGTITSALVGNVTGNVSGSAGTVSGIVPYDHLDLEDSVVNADINSAAEIEYSKLDLTGGIVNADVNASAGIVYSKLSLTGGIVNADVNASAAIVYSKLNLTGGITNSDVNASAAIAYSKLNVPSGAIAYAKLTLTNSVVNADINSAAAIVYSKLALAASVKASDMNSQSATAGYIPIADGSGGVAYGPFSVGAYDSQSVSANGLVVGQTTIYAQSADATHPGMVNTAAQTFAGAKTFTGALTLPTATSSPSANPATSGLMRLARSDTMAWRNQANSGNLVLQVDSSDRLLFNGQLVATGAVTANRVLVSDASGFPIAATTSTTQVQYLAAATGTTGTTSTNLVFSTSPSLTTPTIAGAALSGNLTGTPTFTQAITFTAAPVFSSTTATTAVYVDGSKNLQSSTTTPTQLALLDIAAGRTGTGNLVYSASPTFSGTAVAAAIQVSGLTASQAVVTDGSKNLASLAYASANTVSSLVQRDGSGNFSAGTITATVTGTSSGNTTITPVQYGVVVSSATNALGTIAPDASTAKVLVSGGASANANWSLLTNSNLSGAAAISNANLAAMATMTVKGNVTGGSATPTDVTIASANTASSVVYRDVSGNFVAGTITAALTGTASGNTTYTANQYGLVTSGAANAMTVIAPDASTTKYLRSGGASAVPSWQTIAVAEVTGAAPLASPTFTGTVTLPSGSVSTTAWNTGTSTFTSNGVAFTDKAPLASPTFTGTLTAPSGSITSSAWTTGSSTLAVGGAAGFANGSVTAPSIAWTADQDGTGTGLYRIGANNTGFAANGVSVGNISAAGAWTIGASGGTQSHSVIGQSLTSTYATAGSTTFFGPVHTDNTNSASNAKLYVQVGGTSGGDAFIEYAMTGGTYNWTTGFANGAGAGKFVIGTGGRPTDATQLLTISTAGVVTIGAGTGQIHRLNTSTTATGAAGATLLNAPAGAAGNPDIWLNLNVNGTNYIIPAWTP